MKIKKYWVCPRCTFKNRLAYYDFCQCCGYDKPDEGSKEYKVIEVVKDA